VKGPVTDRPERSHVLEELTGNVHPIQYDAVSRRSPDLAQRTLEAQRCSDSQEQTEMITDSPANGRAAKAQK